ncbi:MAG: beta subunit of fatty acid synthetase [Sclerophora amabilis]|nr:MAG: beta subunit of fatty acid synthetase [Sclerophora amabilis]
MYDLSDAVQKDDDGTEWTSSLWPLVLKYETFEHAFFVPVHLHFRATRSKDSFLSTLSALSAENPAPLSLAELVARYLGFVANDVNTWGKAPSGLHQEIVELFLDAFELTYLEGLEIHALASALSSDGGNGPLVIRSYYAARHVAGRAVVSHDSALFRAAGNGDAARTYAIFGGQGNIENYFDELREIYATYPFFVKELISTSSQLLLSLSQGAIGTHQYPKGLDVLGWLQNAESTPPVDYMLSAPVSLPLIGLSQLANYSVTCKVLGKSPGEILECLSGTTGHSQGIVVAAAIATADTWESFSRAAKFALTILFSIGCRSQHSYPPTSLDHTVIKDSIDHGEGNPSPMLNILNLSRAQVDEQIDQLNRHLPATKQMTVVLVNSAWNFVVAGPPLSLCGLSTKLREIKAPPGLDQSRIPFTERKVQFNIRFLPITVPFHCKYLDNSISSIEEDVKDCEIRSNSLKVPVYHTKTGKNLQHESSVDVVPMLIRMIACDPVDWPQATVFSNATHILDFGPGGVSGVGNLMHRSKDGTGVRVILASTLNGSNTKVGYKPELFDRNLHSLKYGADWLKDHGPRLVNSVGGIMMDTKMSRLLGLPPLMVAAMTPCTVPWDFVAATMNAGFHIELAGGGYVGAKQLTEAVDKLENSIPVGRGITINLIYVNPQALKWQIPIIGQLRAKGAPIEGLTIGAGVPSIDVASEYIQNLGLKHISFKPGSIQAIKQVVSIAKAHPKFPIILQWTGGRGGGHHSFEDFHQPVLQMYGQIRACPNLVLIAGSGFGGSEDTYPYIVGSWSIKLGYPPMPFDGCLFGSRVMVAKEAHTSEAAKKAIVEAEGVDETEWEKTYSGSAGGVITVLSEMGEPIHKLATRGVQLWAEMDRKIFRLEKSKRVAELRKHRQYIIKRLNDDFQKVWFGRKADGSCVDLEEMTYAEVVHRLVELLYVKHESRWIDKSYTRLTGDFIRRMEERLTSDDVSASHLRSYSELVEPFSSVDRILGAYPDAKTQLIMAEDARYFLLLCHRRGQKPVTFVPALDDDFEYWFKKDSLWQSEDLAAVVGQDVGRTCILQGPVAARHSKIIDEPIKDILSDINKAHIASIIRDVYGSNEAAIPRVEYFGGKEAEVKSDENGWTVYQSKGKTAFSIPDSPNTILPDTTAWLELLAGPSRSWRHALLMSERIAQGQRSQANPIRRILAPTPGLLVEIVHPNDPHTTFITVKQTSQSLSPVQTIGISLNSQDEILVRLFAHKTAEGRPVSLTLKYTYHPETGYVPIREIMEDRKERIKAFYSRIWFGEGEGNPKIDAISNAQFEGGKTTLSGQAIKEFIHAVGTTGEDYVERPGKGVVAPMDFAIVVGWKAIMRALFPEVIDCDLLTLVHLSNSFRCFPDVEPLAGGDKVESTARITALINRESGKMVEVCGTIWRDGKPFMEVTSQFLFRGTYDDFQNSFERKTEVPMQLTLTSPSHVAVLKSKEWFHLEEPELNLLGRSLTFRLRSLVCFETRSTYSSVETVGEVLVDLPSKGPVQIAAVKYKAGSSHCNPVLDYLQRHGSTVEQPINLENDIPLGGNETLNILAPASNETYAASSGDYNPIHVSSVFANYVDLPGTITHGMYTSAAVRNLVETLAAERKAGRMRSFRSSFVGMVLPGDELEVKIQHVGMIDGRKVITFEAFKKATKEKVLVGESEVEQPETTFFFTGQGSQELKMGMDLYATSAVARKVWDRADKFFSDTYGFLISDIVKNNPKELTIYFGGRRGARIRQNYLDMTYESHAPDGSTKVEKFFKEIHRHTTSYTYRSPSGLLFTTNFTQPALTIMEKAIFEDMRSKGVVPEESMFAGHSLGEYSALTAIAEIMPIERLLSVVFYRGLTMQVAVDRDEDGRSKFAMVAVDPSRVSKSFDNQALERLVRIISSETKTLLEVVNYNVEGHQYVCAGELEGLDCLTSMTNYIKTQSAESQARLQSTNNHDTAALLELIHQFAAETRQKPQPLELKRGSATIPLRGIDVPFHSTYFRSNLRAFREVLLRNITPASVDPNKLIGKYVSNITGQPFDISKESFQHVYDLTKSDRIRDILADWDRYEVPASATASASGATTTATTSPIVS